MNFMFSLCDKAANEDEISDKLKHGNENILKENSKHKC